MQDYTPEGMLKRIEQLEEENRQVKIVFDLHQETLDNIIDYLESIKPKINKSEEHSKVVDLTLELLNNTTEVYSGRIKSLEESVGNLLKGNY